MVESPCKNVCELDPNTGLCLGCKRTVDEIQNWNLKDNKIVDDLEIINNPREYYYINGYKIKM